MTIDLGVWTADDCAVVPVIGAGVSLEQGASASNTVLGFAVLVGLGVAGAGWGLLGHRPKSSPQAA
jgi:hypothetical protein